MAEDKPMSKAAKKRHIANAGTGECPYCKADTEEHGEYGELEPVEDGDVEQHVKCKKCKRRWLDVFRLVDVHEIASDPKDSEDDEEEDDDEE